MLQRITPTNRNRQRIGLLVVIVFLLLVFGAVLVILDDYPSAPGAEPTRLHSTPLTP